MVNTLQVTSPFDFSEIQTVKLHSASDLEAMLAKAHACHRGRDGWLSHAKRTSILNKLAQLVAELADDFALLIAREGGKPLTDAKIEVARAIDGIRLAAKELMHVMQGTEIPMGHTASSIGRQAWTTYESIGVVAALSAFNHPLNLIVHQVVPAIAVGCPVIVKPASATPLNCLRFVELVHEAGLPEQWCQVCICDNAVAEQLATDSRVAFLSFIGSAKVGWYLRSKLAPGTRCALEHGGVAPVIVERDANLDKAIPALLKGGFYHAGQVCVSVQRIFLHQDIFDEACEHLTAGAGKLNVGDPTLAQTEVGPLIQTSEVDRVDEWVQAAIKAGATHTTGAHKISDTTYAPTVLLNPPQDALVSTREVFGPVICCYSYSDRQKAIDLANSLDMAFQAAVFTQDLGVAHDTAARLDASAVMINDHTAFRVDWMPFAGRRHSGYGIGGIGYTMHDMISHKMTVYNHT